MEFPLEFHDSHYGNEMRMVVKREGAPGMDGMPQTQASSLTHHPHLIQGNQVLLTQDLLGVSLPPSSTADNLVLPGCLQLLLSAANVPLQSVLRSIPGRSFKNTNLVTSSLA